MVLTALVLLPPALCVELGIIAPMLTKLLNSLAVMERIVLDRSMFVQYARLDMHALRQHQLLCISVFLVHTLLEMNQVATIVLQAMNALALLKTSCGPAILEATVRVRKLIARFVQRVTNAIALGRMSAPALRALMRHLEWEFVNIVLRASGVHTQTAVILLLACQERILRAINLIARNVLRGINALQQPQLLLPTAWLVLLALARKQLALCARLDIHVQALILLLLRKLLPNFFLKNIFLSFSKCVFFYEILLLFAIVSAAPVLLAGILTKVVAHALKPMPGNILHSPLWAFLLVRQVIFQSYR